MLKTNKGMLVKNKERYENGFIILRSTQALVAEIEIQVKLKHYEAEEIKNKTYQLAEVVGKEKAKAEVENAKAADQEAKCLLSNKILHRKKKSTQANLDAAIPFVEQAKAALMDLNEKDFQIAKNLLLLLLVWQMSFQLPFSYWLVSMMNKLKLIKIKNLLPMIGRVLKR